jgi:hypothetical protein
MADSKLSSLTAITGANLASGDLFYVADVSAGTAGSKSLTYAELSGIFPILAPNTATRNTIAPANATSAALVVTMAASQSEAPIQLKNNGGTLLLSTGTNGQLISAVTTGTAPLSIASTTVVTNLNADLLDGNEASAFALASHTHGLSTLTGDTYTAGQIIRGTGAGGLLSKFDLGTSGQVLTATSGTGLTWTSLGSASLTASTAYALASHTHTTGDITGLGSAALTASTSYALASHTHGMSSLTGDTFTAGQLMAGTGAGGLLSKLDLGTTGQVLTATSGTGLTWTTPSAGGGGASVARMIFPATALDSLGTNGASLLNLGNATTARLCRGFDDTTETYAYGIFQVPSNINTSGSATFGAVCGLRSSTTGNVLWTYGEREAATSESWSGTYAEYDSAATAMPSATTTQALVTWSTTASTLGWASGDTVRFRVSRDPAASGDATGDALLDLFYIDIPTS